MRHLEDKLQKAILTYFDYKYPQYKLLLHHSPNGGKRNAIEAAKFKQMGRSSRIPRFDSPYPQQVLSFLWHRIKDQNWQAVREPERVSERI